MVHTSVGLLAPLSDPGRIDLHTLREFGELLMGAGIERLPGRGLSPERAASRRRRCSRTAHASAYTSTCPS